MKESVVPSAMSGGRALLTEREREAIAGEQSDSYRYKTRSYFRDRLESLERDLTVLENHDPELLEELREVVCQDRGVKEESQEPAAVDEIGERRVEREPTAPELSEPRDTVADLDLEGSGSVLEERRDALRAIVDHLREEGSADISVLKNIAEEYDFGYQGDVDSFWSNMRRQQALGELPIEPPGQGARTYRYSGEE